MDMPSDSADDFAVFVRSQTPVLFRSAFLLTRDRGMAEDLVQETLTRLYPQWARVRAADAPMAYVRRSMMNNFLSSRRRSSSRELPFADWNALAGPELTSIDPASAVSDRDLVRALLERLSPKARAVVVLRFYHGLSDPEIADELHCREGTVRSILSRALRSLRTDRLVNTSASRSSGGAS